MWMCEYVYHIIYLFPIPVITEKRKQVPPPQLNPNKIIPGDILTERKKKHTHIKNLIVFVSVRLNEIWRH